VGREHDHLEHPPGVRHDGARDDDDHQHHPALVRVGREQLR
jgi:hypothetical protein